MKGDEGIWTVLLRSTRRSVLVLFGTLFLVFLGAEIWGWIIIRPAMGRGPSLSEYRDAVLGYLSFGCLFGLVSLLAIALWWYFGYEKLLTSRDLARDASRGYSLMPWSLVAVPPVVALGFAMALYLLRRGQ
jgi:hypothetical protein